MFLVRSLSGGLGARTRRRRALLPGFLFAFETRGARTWRGVDVGPRDLEYLLLGLYQALVGGDRILTSLYTRVSYPTRVSSPANSEFEIRTGI